VRPGTVPRCDARPRTTRRALPVAVAGRARDRDTRTRHPMRVPRSSIELVSSDVVGSSSRPHASCVCVQLRDFFSKRRRAFPVLPP